MGVFSKVLSSLFLAATEACIMIIITDNGVGPALEAPAHLGILGRAAYYTSRRRFRDFFIPMFTIGLGHECINLWKGRLRDPMDLWVDCLILPSGSWPFSLAATRIEAVKYRDQPWDEMEKNLWTEEMTRREFLERRRR
ncbi:hypothetical protein NPX13_g10215 [Xylaria arbuscula]|uniref:Uncharacterized protein n=1 Tax=Xylaria arbuscula TaxID=114810 RepID=A0A9W8N5H2_9PEZI|nr:hypothetical protein NPX13_g10215 [Xylaria arbuscula]